MEGGSPILGVLGSIGLLLLAITLLIPGIRGLLNSLNTKKDSSWTMVIGGIASAIAGIVLIVITATG